MTEEIPFDLDDFPPGKLYLVMMQRRTGKTTICEKLKKNVGNIFTPENLEYLRKINKKTIFLVDDYDLSNGRYDRTISEIVRRKGTVFAFTPSDNVDMPVDEIYIERIYHINILLHRL